MRRASGCAACENDARRDAEQAAKERGTTAIYYRARDNAAHREVCRRVRTKALQWWEREPGYWRREELPRELARAGREWWPTVRDAYCSVYGRAQDRELARAVAACLVEHVPPSRMTPAQLCAELARQAKRLAGHALADD